VLAAVVLSFGGAAQGTVVYDLGYDPTGFFGNGQLSIDNACVATDGTFTSSSESCPIDLLFDTTHDSGGGNWSSGLIADIAEGMQFDVANHQLVAFDSIALNLTFNGLDIITLRTSGGALSVGCEASGQLQFFRGDNVVTFQGCGGLDTGTYRVPEPASGALILGGLGAAWLARRRRRQG
jgi:hypothetical protein